MTTRPNNLLILAAVLVTVPIITVSICLFIYNTSGDKYIDRSRPGFMPEQITEDEDVVKSYSLPENGPINQAVLDEYLTELDLHTRVFSSDQEYFSDRPLSDDSLGL